MSKIKEQVQAVLDQLPDDCTMEDVQYHLYVADLIRRRVEASETDEGIPHDEVVKRLAPCAPHPLAPLPVKDLEDISDHIAAHSQAYARSMIDRIIAAVERLAEFPGMGAGVTDVRIKGVELREWIVRPYRVIYRLKDNRLVIIAVVHGARRLRTALRGRDLG